MTVARRDAHQIAMIAARCRKQSNRRPAPASPVEVKTPFAEFLLTLFVRARWQIACGGGRNGQKMICFDEI
jgi:hypothetical protein